MSCDALLCMQYDEYPTFSALRCCLHNITTGFKSQLSSTGRLLRSLVSFYRRCFVYFVQESSNPPVSPICFTITSIGLDLSFSAMAVAIDKRVVVEEALVDVHAPDTYRSPLAQPPLPWVETQPSRPERNLVSWALSGTYDEETPVSIAAYKRNC